MQISIIIVSYNVKYFLEQCLCSVKRAIEKIDAEVIVIDNCSTDGSVEYLRENFAWIKLLENDKNEGFAKANNIALKQCKGDYILYLNPDTIVPENIVRDCIDFFIKYKDAGAVGVRMVDGSGNFLPESKRAFPAPLVSFFKLSGLSFLFPQSKLFNQYSLGFLSEDEIHEVDILCGAFLAAPKNILNDLNGFDEAFFLYGEDIDLCYRIQKSGKKIYYAGTNTIVHFKGESSRKGNLNYVRYFYKAMSVFVKKHYSGSNAWLMNVLLHSGIYARAFISLLGSPFRTTKKQIEEKVKASDNNILLIGDAISVEQAERIIRKNIPSAIIDKAKKLSSDECGNLVFCTGDLSYLESIQCLLHSKGKRQYRWHGINTRSVVGSDFKKLTGVVYTLED